MLQGDNTETVTVDMEAGWRYTFIGACDDNCIDLDLVLRLEDRELEMDALLDALPIIEYSPEASAEFEIDVHMVTCDVADCSWRLRGFRRRATDWP